MLKDKKGENFFSNLKDSVKKMVNNPSLPLKEQLGYAGGRFGNEMAQDVVGSFLTLFLAKYVGIEAAMITVLTGAIRIINILCDPVAGTIIDRGFGAGRRNVLKPLLLLTPFPIAVTSILLFVIPAKGITFRIIWVAAFYIIYTITDNFYDMSLSTMSVRMCSDPKDRKDFYTLGQFAASLGVTLPGGVIPIFISIYKNDFKAQGYVYLVAGIVFGVLGLAAMLAPYFTVQERNPLISVKQPKVALNAKALLLNKPMLLVSGAEIMESVRKICYSALAFFYLETLNAFWLSTVVGAVSVVLNYIGMLLVPFIGKKIPPRSMMVYGYLYSGFCYLLLLLVGYQSLWLVGTVIAISGFPNGMLHAAKKIILADSTEYMEWKTWKKYGTPIRSDGMVFALHSMANRINIFFSSIFLPLGLTVIGYVSAEVVNGETVEVTQSAATLRGIFYLVTIPGIAGNFLPSLIMFFDNYTGKYKEDILAELAQMHADEKAEESLPDDAELAQTHNDETAQESLPDDAATEAPSETEE